MALWAFFTEPPQMSIASRQPAPRRRAGSRLTGPDFLLAAAIALVFAVNVASHYLLTASRNLAAPVPAEVGVQTSQPLNDPGLAKARIGFARMT